MDTMISMLSEHWYLFIIAIIIVFLIIKIVKLAIRLALLALIIAGLFIAFTDATIPQTMEEVKSLTNEVKQDVTAKTEEEVIKQIVKRVDGAEYKTEENGDFTLTYDGLIARGNQHEDEIQLYLNGEIHTMNKTEAFKQIQQFINIKE